MSEFPSNKRWLWIGLPLLLALAGGIVWKIASSGHSSVGSPADPQEPDGPMATTDAGVPAQEETVDAKTALAERLGIEISALQVAVNGQRLNLRYRILDADRASRLTNWLNRAYLLDSAGHRLDQPNITLTPTLRRDSGQPVRANRTYSYFFPNPRQTVKPGDKVTLVIGEIRAPDLVVR